MSIHRNGQRAFQLRQRSKQILIPCKFCAATAYSSAIIERHYGHRTRIGVTVLENALTLDLYADGANLLEIEAARSNSYVKGFTTNPTLMRQAGVANYLSFARESCAIVDPLPISLEVFADTSAEIVQQAYQISNLGSNIFVKVPITTTRGESLATAMKELSEAGVKLNITAIMTVEQVEEVCSVLDPATNAIISIFAGRIADAGVDPVPIVRKSVEIAHMNSSHKVLWASPREILNAVQAQDAGCDIITMTADLWKKLPLLGKDLGEFSLDTVKMFYNDAVKAGYSL